MDNWQFGTLLWTSLVFFFWFAAIWMFVSVFMDIFRRDMSGWAKAGWILLIVVLPFLGVLIYLIARPKTAEGYLGADRAMNGRGRTSAVEEISRASQLYDAGRITATEYESIKSRALA